MRGKTVGKHTHLMLWSYEYGRSTGSLSRGGNSLYKV